MLNNTTITIHETSDPAHERRYVLTRITAQAFASLFRTGAQIRCVAGIDAPVDLTGVYYDYTLDVYWLRLTSPALAPVVEGSSIPMIDVTWRTDE